MIISAKRIFILKMRQHKINFIQQSSSSIMTQILKDKETIATSPTFNNHQNKLQQPFIGSLGDHSSVIKMTNRVNAEIEQQIIDSKLTVANKESQFESIGLPLINKKEENKLFNIIKKRKNLHTQMERLKLQELEMKQKSVSPINRNFRSYITKEQKIKINQAILKQKQFEQKSLIKERQLEDKIISAQRQKDEENKKLRQQMLAKRKQNILKSLEELKVKQEERIKMIQALNKNYQRVKKKTFLHEKIEQQWKSREEQMINEDQHQLALRLKEKQFKMQQILEHQKIYKLTSQRQEAERKNKFKQSRSRLVELERQSQYRSSRFLRILIQQQQENHKKQHQKRQQYKTFTEKRLNFAEVVREANKNNSPKKLSPPKQENLKSLKSLNQAQIKKKGNDYMRQVHSSISHIQVPKRIVQKKEEQYFKYPNYLDQAKKNRKSKMNPEQQKQLVELRELKKIMKNRKSTQDKFYHAKIVANKLEQRSKGNTNMIISSINAKLQILRQFGNF